MTLCMVVGTIMSFALGVVFPFLREDYGLSPQVLGLLNMALFSVAAVASPLVGRAVDRWGGRRLAATGLLLASTGFLVAGLGPGVLWLALGVCLAGTAIAVGNPATNQLIGLYAPTGARGVVLGLKQSGVQLAAVVAGAVIPLLATVAGWRAALASCALLGPLVLVVLLTVVPGRGRSHGVDRGPSKAPPPDDAPARGSRAESRWLMAYAVLMGAGVSSTAVFLPVYAFDRVTADVQIAGATAAVLGGVGVVSRIFWGRVGETVRQPRPLLAVLAAVSVGGQLLVAGADRGSAALLWSGVVVLGASASAWNSVGMLIVLRAFPMRLAGSVSGRVQSAFYVGFIVSPLLFGWLLERTGSYVLGWVVMAGLYGLAVGVAWRWYRWDVRRLTPVASGD